VAEPRDSSIETVEECRAPLQHLPADRQFMLANDGWREGRTLGKCHKDTSVAEADAFAKKSIFQRHVKHLSFST